MKLELSVFKAYDIRGLANTQLTPEFAYLLGRAYARVINPVVKRVCVGRDVRTSGEVLFPAVVLGLQAEGIEVTSIGIITTEQLYFACANYGFGGGISVTASHNPPEYNGFKMVRAGALPISMESGINDIRVEMEKMIDEGVSVPQNLEDVVVKEVTNLFDDYLEYLNKFVDLRELSKSMRTMTIGFNPNHGAVGEVMKKLIEKYSLPITPVWLYENIDGSFPQGRPDPMYETNQQAFKAVLNSSGAEFGVAWDADADRCFFFDSNGNFIDGYYIVGVLAKLMIKKHPSTKIVHDPRLTWATIDTVKSHGGQPIISRVGHSYIKTLMRKEDAAFGGENSGHYYFRDFWYADSGLIPFLLILEEISKQNIKIDELVIELMKKYPTTGEINFTVNDADVVIERIKKTFENILDPVQIDGVSVAATDWRCNVRKSNTEPVVRLNLEAKSLDLLNQKKEELIKLITE